VKLLKKFPAFYETQRFITVLKNSSTGPHPDSRQTPNLEDNPLLAVSDCLFSVVFAAIIHTLSLSLLSAMRTRHAVVTRNKIHTNNYFPTPDTLWLHTGCGTLFYAKGLEENALLPICSGRFMCSAPISFQGTFMVWLLNDLDLTNLITLSQSDNISDGHLQ
jgi:hypothetical protein